MTEIKRNGTYYSVYVDGKEYCNCDTVEECKEEIAELEREK